MPKILVFYKSKLWMRFATYLSVMLISSQHLRPNIANLIAGNAIELSRLDVMAMIIMPVLFYFLLYSMKRLFFVGDAIRFYGDRIWFNSGLFGRSYYWTHIDVVRLVKRERYVNGFIRQVLTELHVIRAGKTRLRFLMNDVEFDQQSLQAHFSLRVQFEFEDRASKPLETGELGPVSEAAGASEVSEVDKPPKKLAYGVRKRKW